MARSKSFFGLRCGSTKSLTFQVYRGQQITKDRVYRVSNPRTDAQMSQRALIPIVAAARSALKGLIDHSFEGIAYGEASLKEFSRQNLRAGALTVTSYTPNGISNPGFADLIVSNGSINVPYEVRSKAWVNSVVVSGQALPPFRFPAVDEGDSADVILKYLETYARINNVAIIAPGTQLSFLTIYQSGTVKVNTGKETIDAPTSDFALHRIYIPNGDSDSESDKAINDQWIVREHHSQDSNRAGLINSNGDRIAFIMGVDKTIVIECRPKVIGHASNCGMALIISRYENGVWKRSPSRLNIAVNPKTTYTFEDWLSTYQATDTASKKYLNTGDEGTGIQG